MKKKSRNYIKVVKDIISNEYSEFIFINLKLLDETDIVILELNKILESKS